MKKKLKGEEYDNVQDGWSYGEEEKMEINKCICSEVPTRDKILVKCNAGDIFCIVILSCNS